MTRLPCIRELTVDSAGVGFFLCCRKETRGTRSGAAFIALELQDATGQIAAKIFDDCDRYRDEFEAGEFVKIEARAEVYAGRLELIVSRIRRVDTDQDGEHGFREAECIPASPRDIEQMWRELNTRLAEVQDPGLKVLLHRVVQDYEAQLKQWPAAVTVHHAYRGGLLEHVLQVTRVAVALAELYDADRDLVLAGAVLHDIGKLRELEYALTTTYSREGNLVGHIPLGLMMVREASQGIASLTLDRRAELEHLVASHHGSRERGSPVEPMSVEAFILAAADELDARIHQVRRHVDADDADGDFTAYHPRLKRVLLKPSRTRSPEQS
jgi:3'-5' exoribonuclease